MIQPETPRVRKYQFSDADLTKAKMLSQESIAYFEHQAADLLNELVNIQFSSDPVLQQDQIFQFIATQSRYKFLLETLGEVQETYQALATGESNPDAGIPPSTF